MIERSYNFIFSRIISKIKIQQQKARRASCKL